MPRLLPPILAAALLLVALPARAAAGKTEAAAFEKTFFANQFAKLQANAQAALKANPKDLTAEAYLGRALYKQGKWDAARAALAKAGTRDLEGVLANADFLLYVGEIAGATGLFQKARQLDPGHSHAAYGLGSCDLETGAFDQAYDLAQGAEGMAAREGTYQQSRILSILGGAQGLKADHGSLMDKLRFGPRVRSTLERALSLAPNNPNAIYAIARFYLEAPGPIGGSPAKSVAFFEKAMAVDPYFYKAHEWYVRALLATGKAARAHEQLAMYRRKFAGLTAPIREVADLK